VSATYSGVPDSNTCQVMLRSSAEKTGWSPTTSSAASVQTSGSRASRSSSYSQIAAIGWPSTSSMYATAASPATSLSVVFSRACVAS